MSRFHRVAYIIISTFLLLSGSESAAQFETRASASTGTYLPFSAAVGDFNADGILDIAVVSFLPSSNVTIFLEKRRRHLSNWCIVCRRLTAAVCYSRKLEGQRSP